MAIVPLEAPLLAQESGIRHGFFGRKGGVSEGLFATLNCGFGADDEPERVAENRRRAMAGLGRPAEGLVTAYQFHSAEVVLVEQPWSRDAAPRADAMVTRAPQVTLGVLAADCVPILLADAEAKLVGAAHAGWKGALAGVVAAVVAAMIEQGAEAERLVAAIGPAIAQPSYEVGPEFPGPFLAQAHENRRYFKPSSRAGHWLFDIKGYVTARLVAAGIERVDCLPQDTYAEEEAYFSYRRACHSGEADYGRNLSAIGLEA